MKVKITIMCDNAAFEDCPEDEVARILRTEADNMQHNGLYNKIVLDLNGNRVGDITVTGKRN